MSAPFSFMGNSNVLIDVLTDEGASTGLQLKGNCPSLTIKGDSERIDEIARMLGGVNITDTTRRHAAEMLGLQAPA